MLQNGCLGNAVESRSTKAVRSPGTGACTRHPPQRKQQVGVCLKRLSAERKSHSFT